MNDRPRRPSLLPIVLLLSMIVLGSAGIFAYATLKPLVAMTGQVVPRVPAGGQGVAAPGAAAPAPAVAGGAAPSSETPSSAGAGSPAPSAAPPIATSEPLPTIGPLPSLERKQRVNFLLLGSDTDLKFAPGQYLTQSMIVVSVDPATHTVGMLSIPRDLWVRIPNYGYGKIQTAYEVGGVATARATIEQNFGIPIHYYAWVGLQGFTKMIDTVGGVTLDITHPVLDDTYPDDLNPSDPYAFMRLYLPAGPRHLSGVEALQFVRSRHGDLIGDFGRSTRQQQLLLALRQRLTGPTVVTHLPQLTSDLSDSVRTDVPLTDLLQYASFARGLTHDDIHQVVLQPPTYSVNGTSPDGTQQIVIPNWSAIDQAVAQLFQVQLRPAPGTRASGAVQVATPLPGRPAAAAAPEAPARPAAQPTAEHPAPTATAAPKLEPAGPIMVQVENGTSVPGLGQRATQYLAGSGFRLAAPVNAGRMGVPRTTVTFYQPAAREVAFSVARITGGTVVAGSRPPGAGPNVVVLLGQDAAGRF